MSKRLVTTIPVGNLRYLREKLGERAFQDAVQQVVHRVGAELREELLSHADNYSNEWYHIRIEPGR